MVDGKEMPPIGQRTSRKQRPKPRTKPSEVRRSELLDAAARLFIAQGVEETTVEEITLAAGVAKGTFYLHFASKPEIVIALRERFIEGFRARIRTALDSCGQEDWPERLNAWVASAVGAYLDGYELHDVVFHDYRPHFRQMKGENIVVTDLAMMLTAGARAAAWKLDDPRLTAIVLFQGLHGAVDDAIANDEKDGDRLSAHLSELFLRMLGTNRQAG